MFSFSKLDLAHDSPLEASVRVFADRSRSRHLLASFAPSRLGEVADITVCSTFQAVLLHEQDCVYNSRAHFAAQLAAQVHFRLVFKFHNQARRSSRGGREQGLVSAELEMSMVLNFFAGGSYLNIIHHHKY